MVALSAINSQRQIYVQSVADCHGLVLLGELGRDISKYPRGRFAGVGPSVSR